MIKTFFGILCIAFLKNHTDFFEEFRVVVIVFVAAAVVGGGGGGGGVVIVAVVFAIGLHRRCFSLTRGWETRGPWPWLSL